MVDGVIKIQSIVTQGDRRQKRVNVGLAPWNICNNNCLMCPNPPEIRKQKWVTCDEIISYIERMLSRGKIKADSVDTVIITGGEPTIYPALFDLLQYLNLKFSKSKITILTNGRKLCYKDFSRQLLHFKNINLTVSLLSSDASTHDSIAQAEGSFHQCLRGLNNILKYKDENSLLELRHVISKINYRDIQKTLDFICANFSEFLRIVFIFFEIEGCGKKNLKKIALKYSQLAPYLKRLKFPSENKKEFCLYHFPLCVLDQKLWKFTCRTLEKSDVTYLKNCRQCRVKPLCLGIPKEYLEVWGEKEFSPIRDKLTIEKTGNYYRPISSVLNQKP